MRNGLNNVAALKSSRKAQRFIGPRPRLAAQPKGLAGLAECGVWKGQLDRPTVLACRMGWLDKQGGLAELAG